VNFCFVLFFKFFSLFCSPLFYNEQTTSNFLQRERERERERDRERQRETERDRDRDRDSEREGGRNLNSYSNVARH